MGIINTIRETLSSSQGVSAQELSQAPLDQDVEKKLTSLEEENAQLRQDLQQKSQQEDPRIARLEERLQRKEQEQEQMQSEMRERVGQLQEQQETATVSRPPPDDRALEGNPVISADGTRIFGSFVRWISEGDKIGIEADHPREEGRVKIGWTDSMRDLVVDANRLVHKDAIVVKFDSNGEPMDFVPPARYQEVVQKKDRIEQQKNRLSMEVDELNKQVRKLSNLNQKLITTRSMDMVDRPDDNGSREMEIRRLAHERELDKGHIDELSEMNSNRRRHMDEVISQYEEAMNGQLGNISKKDTDMAIEETGDLLRKFIREVFGSMDDLDPETKEDLLQAIGGGNGGAISIVDE